MSLRDLSEDSRYTADGRNMTLKRQGTLTIAVVPLEVGFDVQRVPIGDIGELENGVWRPSPLLPPLPQPRRL
jgi:hypothetical protein